MASTASVVEIRKEANKAVKELQEWFKVGGVKLDSLDIEHMRNAIELACMRIAWGQDGAR